MPLTPEQINELQALVGMLKEAYQGGLGASYTDPLLTDSETQQEAAKYLIDALGEDVRPMFCLDPAIIMSLSASKIDDSPIPDMSAESITAMLALQHTVKTTPENQRLFLLSIQNLLPHLVHNQAQLHMIMQQVNERNQAIVLAAVRGKLPAIANTPPTPAAPEQSIAKTPDFQAHLKDLEDLDKTRAATLLVGSTRTKLEKYIAAGEKSWRFTWGFIWLTQIGHFFYTGNWFSPQEADIKLDAAQDALMRLDNNQPLDDSVMLTFSKVGSMPPESPEEHLGQYVYGNDKHGAFGLGYVTPRGEYRACSIRDTGKVEKFLFGDRYEHGNEQPAQVQRTQSEAQVALARNLFDILPTTRQQEAMERGVLGDIVGTARDIQALEEAHQADAEPPQKPPSPGGS